MDTIRCNYDGDTDRKFPRKPNFNEIKVQHLICTPIKI